MKNCHRDSPKLYSALICIVAESIPTWVGSNVLYEEEFRAVEAWFVKDLSGNQYPL